MASGHASGGRGNQEDGGYLRPLGPCWRPWRLSRPVRSLPLPGTGLRMLEATALVNLGREEEAEALLDQVPDQEQGDYRMQKLQLRAILCNRRGRTEEAEELAGKMEELMVQAGRDNGRREVFCLRCTARLKRGEADGLEEGLRRYITCGGPLLSQVGDHLLLGRYCLAVGRIEEAGEHLTFAAERGGPCMWEKRRRSCFGPSANPRGTEKLREN